MKTKKARKVRKSVSYHPDIHAAVEKMAKRYNVSFSAMVNILLKESALQRGSLL